MLRFKSIFVRIIFLHVIALLIVSVAILLALHWLLDAATGRLHYEAMLEQAELISRLLVERPDGSLVLELPDSLRDLYSTAYGRYRYAFIDEAGRVLFSSRNDAEPIFPPATSFAEELRSERNEDGTIRGVSISRRAAG